MDASEPSPLPDRAKNPPSLEALKQRAEAALRKVRETIEQSRQLREALIFTVSEQKAIIRELRWRQLRSMT